MVEAQLVKYPVNALSYRVRAESHLDADIPVSKPICNQLDSAQLSRIQFPAQLSIVNQRHC